MADNPKKRGQPDRIRINVNEDYERRRWAKKFDVTQDRLRQTVRKVGPMVKDVKKALGK
jgi:hypothetical protein